MMEALEQAAGMARMKILAKTGASFAVCIIAGIITASAGMNWAVVVVPFTVSLVPLLLGVRYAVLMGRGLIAYTVCEITEKRRDVVGGLMSGVSLSHRKYTFRFMSEEGREEKFDISRGGWLTAYSVGDLYLVMHRKDSPPARDNFIEAVPVGRKTGKEKRPNEDREIQG